MLPPLHLDAIDILEVIGIGDSAFGDNLLTGDNLEEDSFTQAIPGVEIEVEGFLFFGIGGEFLYG